MNVKILEEKKNRIAFVVEGDSHTLSAALRTELNASDKIDAAGYHLEHPLLGQPHFVVEGEAPRKNVVDALRKLSKQADKLAGEAAKEL